MLNGRTGDVRGPSAGPPDGDEAPPRSVRLFRLCFLSKRRSPNAWKVATSVRLIGRVHPTQIHLGYVPRNREELTEGDRNKLLDHLKTKVDPRALLPACSSVGIQWEDTARKLQEARARATPPRPLPWVATAAATATPPRLESHLPALMRRALLLTRNDQAAAEDLVNDTIVRSLQILARREVTDLGNWLLRVQRNLFVDQWRAAATRQAVPLSDHDLTVDALEERPNVELWKEVAEGDLAWAVERLPSHLRETWNLLAENNGRYGDIATVLGIPLATVGTRIHRARKCLRDLLESRRQGDREEEDAIVEGGHAHG